MHVTIMWIGEAADAQGRETKWTGIDWVEEHPDELRLHTEEGDHPVVVDRDYVIAFNRTE